MKERLAVIGLVLASLALRTVRAAVGCDVSGDAR